MSDTTPTTRPPNTAVAVALQKLRAATDEAMGAAELLDDERRRLAEDIALAREEPRAATREAHEALADLRQERRNLETLLARIEQAMQVDIAKMAEAQMQDMLDVAAEAMVPNFKQTAERVLRAWLEENGPLIIESLGGEVTAERAAKMRKAGLALPPPAIPPSKPVKGKGIRELQAEIEDHPTQLPPPRGPVTILYKDRKSGKVKHEREGMHHGSGRITMVNQGRGHPLNEANYLVTARYGDGEERDLIFVGESEVTENTPKSSAAAFNVKGLDEPVLLEFLASTGSVMFTLMLEPNMRVKPEVPPHVWFGAARVRMSQEGKSATPSMKEFRKMLSQLAPE